MKIAHLHPATKTTRNLQAYMLPVTGKYAVILLCIGFIYSSVSQYENHTKQRRCPLKRLTFLFTTITLTFALALAACGSAPSNGGGYSTGNTGSSAPAASTHAIGTAGATVSGKSVTLLTNTNGMTLYYFKPDTATTAACTGDCASTWPPELATSAPTSTAS